MVQYFFSLVQYQRDISNPTINNKTGIPIATDVKHPNK